VVTAAPTRARVALPDWLSPALASGGAAAFALAVVTKSSTSSFADLLLALLAVLGMAFVIRLLFLTPAFRPIAVLLAAGAAWLLPQRDDIGAAAIAAAFFGAGLALVLPRLARSRAALLGGAAGIVVTLIAHAFDSQTI
jgi:hypothetical protein